MGGEGGRLTSEGFATESSPRRCRQRPAQAFLVARDRTTRIRSVAEPWGLADRSKFSEKDHLSLQYGNKILKATIKILYLLLELRIPAIMENPRSSRMWSACMFVGAHVCMHACMYVCMYVCMSVCEVYVFMLKTYTFLFARRI